MKEQLKETEKGIWMLPKTAKEGMLVDARIVADKEILDSLEEGSVEQLSNAAMLPGVIGPVLAMSDAHFGYGVCVGSVIAFDMDKGVISAGLVGFDVNCGINMIRTNLNISEVKPKLKELTNALFDAIPCGVGSKGKLKVTKDELKDVMKEGLNWAIKNGYGTKRDAEHTEENGKMDGADPSKVSELAMKRGLSQLGTLGAGNHFHRLPQDTSGCCKKIRDKTP